MFSNTITLTINSVVKVLNRVNQDSYGSEYSLNSGTESIVMKIRHSADSVDGDGVVMKRHNVFVEHIVYPTPTTALQKFTATTTLRHGKFDDPTKSSDLVKALGAWIGSTTVAAQLAAGEN
jgi:hypothetical protein